MSQQSNYPTLPQLLRRPVVEQLTGLSRTGIYRKMAQGDFPKSVALGGKSVAWLASDVAAWIDSRVAASKGVQA